MSETLDPQAEAQAATEGLRDALRQHSISLPGLAINLAGVLAGYPLVDLGSADAETVRRITAALRAAPMN